MRSKVPPRQPDRHSQGTRPKRGLGLWIRRGPVWSLLTLLALAVVGATYQAIATQIDQRSISPAPGQMVGVGNHQLHLNCVGKGSPTVILEAGWTFTSLEWSTYVQPYVALTAGRLKIAQGLPLWPTLREELLTFRRKIGLKTAHASFEHHTASGHGDLVIATALAVWKAGNTG